VIPKLFSNEPALFEPTRLAIACEVARESDDEMTFVQLRHSLGLTDGNLNRHLQRLVSEGILTCTREKQTARRTRTVVRITRDGRNRLAAFAEALADAAHHGRSVTAGTRLLTETGTTGTRRRIKTSAMQSKSTAVVPDLAGPSGTTAMNLVDERFAGID
jgi:DNA-binding PadR family transcriptional regulator